MLYVPSVGGGIDQPDYSIDFVKLVVRVLHFQNGGSLNESFLLGVLETTVVKILFLGRQLVGLQNHTELFHLTGTLCFNY